jgi:PAS domain S-box-containing protein
MKRWLSGGKIPLPVVIAGLALVTLVLLSIPFLFFTRHVIQKRLSGDAMNILCQVNQEWTTRLNEKMALARESIGRFSKVLSDMPVEAPQRGAQRFDALVGRDADGAWRSRHESYVPFDEAGIWLPASYPITPERKSFLVKARNMTGLYGKGALNHFVDTWVMPREGGIVIYWPTEPDFVYAAGADFDYTNTEWMTLTRPDVNPEGLPRLTTTSFDPSPKIWMISIVAPYRRGGEWAGSVGHDFPISSIVQQIHSVEIYPRTDYLLLRGDGTLLLSNRYTERIQATGGRFALSDTGDEELLDFWGSIPDVLKDRASYTYRGRTHVYVASRVRETGWFFITSTPRSEILQVIRASYISIWGSSACFLFLFCVISFLFVSGLIIPPVRRLLRGTEKVAGGNLDYVFPPEWSREFHSISDSITRMVATLKDTLRQARDAEQTALMSEEKYKRLVDNLTNSVLYRHNLEGVLTYVSSSVTKVLGYTVEECLGHYAEYMTDHPANQDVQRRTELSIQGIQQPPYEMQVRDKDGEIRWFEVVDVPVRNAAGEVEAVEGIAHDITQRKWAEEEKVRIESQFQQAQKMESVGRLAGGVAHDFNNMLGVILGHLDLAMTQLGPEQPLYGHLEEIRQAARRSADLTRQLLTFARKQAILPQVLDLNATIGGLLKMLQRLIGEDINLQWLPAANLWTVKVDPTQIDQILVNLCVNARDAIDNTGQIVIETENNRFDEDYCAVHPTFVPGEYVRLSVSDDGCGMDKETLAHIFEPFFTTKAQGRGTGLGLATVYGIMRQNEGFINIYSEPGRGTIFSIYLPRHAGEIEPKPEEMEAQANTAVPGDETILLVEDEEAILNMTSTMLQRLGYTVLAAASPGDAIRLAQEHGASIHLLITDVIMPEMNGRELAQRIFTLYPGLKRLFMSGYTADVIAHRGVLEDGVQFIQKPFTLKDLSAKIREVLKQK